MKTLKLALLVSLLSVLTAQAETSIAGTWILEKSENPMPDGSTVSYCTGVHGMAIYTEDGYVSISLNCGPRGEKPEPADVSGRKFFYAGSYEFDGEKVTHLLMNASDTNLIGEKPVRKVVLDGDRLVLIGENQGQVFSAFWRRAK